MIIISRTRNNQYKVQYTGKNNEILATSETLKTKKNAWKNIYAMAKCFFEDAYLRVHGDCADIAIKDMTVENPEVFVYDINGIKKKAGVRK